MKKFLLIASAAAMAASMPALADPGKGKGRGGDDDDRRGRSVQKMDRDDDRRRRGGPRFARAAYDDDRGSGRGRVARGDDDDDDDRERRGWRGRDRDDDDDDDRRRWRGRDRDDDDRRRWRGRDRDDDRRRWRGRDRDDDRWEDRRDWARARGFCPPGLARKNNGCLPPGQAKKVYARGERFDSDWYDDYIPAGYRSLYYDTPDYYYRYDDDGYIYRVNRDTNLVSSLIPLLGGGFGVGQMLPSGYDIYNVPLQYRDVYYDTPDAYYRYGDNAIYQVDPQTQMIESVVALLAGDTLGIGQVLPAGYGAYNVPLGYRDRYYDTDEYLYRYADGNIYQVDAQTQIIQGIISALV